MNRFRAYLEKDDISFQKSDGTPKSSGEILTELTGGDNLVDGKQTHELFDDFKNDIEVMKRCCDAELLTMNKSDFVPAPAYFLRVAILSRKTKNFQQEVLYCEKYIDAVESFYSKHIDANHYDVRKGPTYKSIVKRLGKARELLKSQ